LLIGPQKIAENWNIRHLKKYILFRRPTHWTGGLRYSIHKYEPPGQIL
jgi:hypothetical protein